jgi:hypothetical protein
MGRIIPYIMENKKCLKPPTRYIMYELYAVYIIIYPEFISRAAAAQATAGCEEKELERTSHYR